MSDPNDDKKHNQEKKGWSEELMMNDNMSCTGNALETAATMGDRVDDKTEDANTGQFSIWSPSKACLRAYRPCMTLSHNYQLWWNLGNAMISTIKLAGEPASWRQAKRTRRSNLPRNSQEKDSTDHIFL